MLKGRINKYTILNTENGTSLIEVITVAAISIIVVFATYILIDSANKVQLDVQNKTLLARDSRVAMNDIVKEVRQRKIFIASSSDPLDQTHLQMQKYSSIPNETIDLYYFTEAQSGDPGLYVLKKRIEKSLNSVPTSTSTMTLAKNIVNGGGAAASDDPMFRYYFRDASGSQTEIGQLDQRQASTRWVRILLIMDRKPTDEAGRLKVENDVAIRNN